LKSPSRFYKPKYSIDISNQDLQFETDINPDRSEISIDMNCIRP